MNKNIAIGIVAVTIILACLVPVFVANDELPQPELATATPTVAILPTPTTAPTPLAIIPIRGRK